MPALNGQSGHTCRFFILSITTFFFSCSLFQVVPYLPMGLSRLDEKSRFSGVVPPSYPHQNRTCMDASMGAKRQKAWAEACPDPGLAHDASSRRWSSSLLWGGGDPAVAFYTAPRRLTRNHQVLAIGSQPWISVADCAIEDA